MSATLLRSVVWNGGDLSLMESCALWRRDSGFTLDGTVVGMLGGTGFSARYRVDGSADWRTRTVWVQLSAPPDTREVRIEVDSASRWTVNGVERPDFAELADVDIQITPATNTLPIRRLSLPVGERAELTAGWVRFPSLDVTRLPQSYRRLDERRYEYASGTFKAELEVDEHGLVERYGSFWRRVHTG